MSNQLNLILHGAYIVVQTSSGLEIIASHVFDQAGLNQHVYKLGLRELERDVTYGPNTLHGLTAPRQPAGFTLATNICFHKDLEVRRNGAYTILKIPVRPTWIYPMRVIKADSVIFSGTDASAIRATGFSMVDVLVFNFVQLQDVFVADDAGRHLWSAMEAGIGPVTLHLFAAPPDEHATGHNGMAFAQMVALTNLDLHATFNSLSVPRPPVNPGIPGVANEDLWSLGERLHGGPPLGVDASRSGNNKVLPDDCLKIVSDVS